MSRRKLRTRADGERVTFRTFAEPGLFLLPFLIGLLVFTVYPFINVILLSFRQDYSLMTGEFSGIGLGNYAEIFHDANFLNGLRNTALYVLFVVPIVTVLSLFLASLLNSCTKLQGLFQTCYFLPMVTSVTAVGLVWKWMFNNYYGIFNYLGKSMGLLDQNINWLGDTRYALACIILILLTTSVGQPIVLYVSALGNVDQSLVEAAEVDGATKLQAFWKIKWPQIMPTTLYILVITTINSFQCFALIQLLTSGGPNHATDTIMYYIYYTAFKLYRYGYGNAMGVILALMIAVLSAVQFKVTQSD